MLSLMKSASVEVLINQYTVAFVVILFLCLLLCACLGAVVMLIPDACGNFQFSVCCS